MVYFVGTAGAGKSTLVAAYDRWLREHGLTTIVVNLDPGVEHLPYEPDIDIRETIRLADIMVEHNLGPNGAQIAAADMMALHAEELMEEIHAMRADQVLIDTPGQLELFVFRTAGKHLVETLAPGRSIIAYLMDPFLARTATGFASQLMLGATTQVRMQEPMAFLLSKSDRIDAESLETVLGWAADVESLESDILAAQPTMDREFAAHVTRLLDGMGLENILVPVSAVDGTGLDDLYAHLQGTIGGGEDSTPEYDTFLGPDEPESW